MHFLLDITHAAGKTKLLGYYKVEMLVLNCQSEFNIYKHAEYTAKVTIKHNFNSFLQQIQELKKYNLKAVGLGERKGGEFDSGETWIGEKTASWCNNRQIHRPLCAITHIKIGRERYPRVLPCFVLIGN